MTEAAVHDETGDPLAAGRDAFARHDERDVAIRGVSAPIRIATISWR